MNSKIEKSTILISGLIIGIIGSLMVRLGNPSNMGFCIACFIRDTAGALGLHAAEPVRYIRPEIIGIIIGSFAISLFTKEYRSRGGSSPFTRFILGIFIMIGCLTFLGCPLRMILRLAGGDLNALVGFVGFTLGILVGVIFLKRGFSLSRSYRQPALDGGIITAVSVALLILLIAAPSFIHFSEEGPGSKHAAIIISLVAGLIVGALAQKTRFCMAGGIRDLLLFRDMHLFLGLIGVLVGCLSCNLIISGVTDTSYFKLAFDNQPIAHTDGLWNALGMFVVGLGSILVGGCPLRQLVMSGEGNSDSAITILGLFTGAAICHSFGLAASADGPTPSGKIALVIALTATLIISFIGTKSDRN